MSGSGTGGEERPGGRSGRHAAPRHAARSEGPREPVRFDTARLPHAADQAAERDRPSAGGSGRTLPLLQLALGITASVVAWGYLVYLAIDFGTSARDGESAGWWFLGLATIGAIACLFLGLLLVARLVARIKGGAPPPPRPPRIPGGRRAAR